MGYILEHISAKTNNVVVLEIKIIKYGKEAQTPIK